MSTPTEVIIRYRLERAREALDEARLMAASLRWNTCVSRLYYSCFYAVAALLLRHGMSSAKHSGVRALFNQHFVKTGVVERELGALFNELFDARHEADYEDLVRFDADAVAPWLSGADRLVVAIEQLLTPDKTASSE